MTPYDTIKTAIIGNPGLSTHQPSPQGVVRGFAEMQSLLEAAQNGGAIIKETYAALDALATVPFANIMAWVMKDPTNALNGIYGNVGTAGAPDFVRIGDIPQFSVTAVNVGAGSANAIIATSDMPIPTQDARAMIFLNIVVANSGPATVRLNGGPELAIVTNEGNAIAANYLTVGMWAMGVISDAGTKFRLLSNQVASSIVAAAEAARDAALAAAASVQPAVFATAALASAAAFAPEMAIIDGAVFDRSNTDPGDGSAIPMAGKFMIMRRSPTIQLGSAPFRSLLGTVGVSDSSPGVMAALNYMGAQTPTGAKLVFPRQTNMKWRITNAPDFAEIDFNWTQQNGVSTSHGYMNLISGVYNATRFTLAVAANAGDMVISVTGSLNFAVGDYIWIYDGSVRLSDSQPNINHEIRRVVRLTAGTPNLVYLDMPLSFKKDITAGGGRNVALLTMKKGIKLYNLETKPLNASSGGATGLLLNYCIDAEVWGRKNTNGATGAANDIRACFNVQGGGFRDELPQDPLHYHNSMLHGSRECHFRDGYDKGVRHSGDMDSTDLCSYTDWISEGALSTPFVMAHNGMGGFGNRVEATVIDGPDSTGGYGFFNTQGWNTVTGQGSNELAYPILSPTVKIKGNCKRAGNTFGVYFQQPFKDANIDVDLICGDNISYDPSVNLTAAVRVYQCGNTGDVIVRKSRGFNYAYMNSAFSLATDARNVVNLWIKDHDYARGAFYLSGADGIRIEELKTGSNISVFLCHLENSAASLLRHFSYKNIVSKAPINKLFNIVGVGTGILGDASGSMGAMDTLMTIPAKTLAADGPITFEDVWTNGENPLRVDGTAGAPNITALPIGIWPGQSFFIYSTTANTFPVSITTSTTYASAGLTQNIVLGLQVIELKWTGASWRPVERQPQQRRVLTISTDAGATIDAQSFYQNVVHTGTLTANRTLTLGTLGAVMGQTCECSRSGGGAFTLTFAGKALATGQWARAVFNGSAWVLAAFGSL